MEVLNINFCCFITIVRVSWLCDPSTSVPVT